MGKPDMTAVDIADSVGYVVGRKGHFVAQTAEIDITPIAVGAISLRLYLMSG